MEYGYKNIEGDNANKENLLKVGTSILGGVVGIFIGDKKRKAQEKAHTRAKQELEHEDRLMAMKMRDLQEKDTSSENAYQIRRELQKAERSAKIKSGLITAGILIVVLGAGGYFAYKIIKK